MFEHKQEMTVEIAAKGKGVIYSFVASYTMKEHYLGLPEKHGQSVAEHHLNITDPMVSIRPVNEPPEIKREVEKFLEAQEDDLLFDAMVNPLQNCYRNYDLLDVNGVLVAVSKPYSFGYCYGIVCPEWIEEAGDTSSIQYAA